eukprot:gene1798-33218_t
MIDGLNGDYCDEVTEMYCPNQCAGQGECNQGFCKCKPGCNGASKAVPDSLEAKPWVTHSGFGLPPPAGIEDGDPGYAPADHLHGLGKRPLARKRPFIYVYDIPPPYTTRMLQYRLSCKNAPVPTLMTTNWIYGIETYLHETLLASPHRTLDPEEAEAGFFFELNLNPTQIKTALIRTQEPDEAGFFCMPLFNTTLDPEEADFFYVPVYITCFFWPVVGYADFPYWYSPAGHECYNPKKDLVIPSYKPPTHFSDSPLLNGEPLHKDVLLFFRGDVGNRRLPNYSRGIRQKIFNLAEQNHWREKYQIVVEEQMYGTTNTYSSMLARSTFCLVAPGDGWSARAEDAVLHGCIPLPAAQISRRCSGRPPAKIGRMQRRLVQNQNVKKQQRTAQEPRSKVAQSCQPEETEMKTQKHKAVCRVQAQRGPVVGYRLHPVEARIGACASYREQRATSSTLLSGTKKGPRTLGIA